MDVVALFSIAVFAASWWVYARSAADEPLTRLFFASLMVLAAVVGGLGLVLRNLG